MEHKIVTESTTNCLRSGGKPSFGAYKLYKGSTAHTIDKCITSEN